MLILLAAPGAALAVVALAAFVFHLVRAQPAYLRRAQILAADRVTVALAFSLIVAIGTGTVFAATSGSNFQLAGIQRYLTAPLIYAAFTLVLLTTTTLLLRPPAWAIIPAVLVAISMLAAPLTGDTFVIASLNQGVVLLIGVPLLGIVGALAAVWSPRQQTALIGLLCTSGAISALLDFATGVFSALVFPASVALIYLATRRVRAWPLLAAIGLYLIVSSQVANSEAQDPSAATSGQIVVAAAVFALALIPVRMRLVVAAGAALAGIFIALSSPVPGLMLGIGADLEDVTLAQRAYESQQVIAQAQQHPLAILIGGGPGATVNLVKSPDASTLEGSGRNLLAVPSVHLLTTYVFLKLGLLGLGWLLLFLLAFALAGWRVLREAKPDRTQLILLVFVATGITQALPAATFLFSNPLPALLLGVLTTLQRPRRAQRAASIRLARLP